MSSRYKNYKILSVLFIFACSCQHINAGEGKEISQQSTESSNPEKSSLQLPETNGTLSQSSLHKPSGLLFKLDFEDGEVVPVKGQESSYDILRIPTSKGPTKALAIYYEAGKPVDRRARIEIDPTNKNNKVLHYWLKNARIPGQRTGKFKGRIQLNLAGLTEKSVYQRYRLFLHPDIGYYKKYPARNLWFGISTMWMGALWRGHPYPFTISLNIVKPAGAGKPLHFAVSGLVADGGEIGKGIWKPIWGHMGANYDVPVGEWLDVEVGYKAGNKNTGRFYMGVKGEQDSEFTTVFDINDWTYHPDSPEPVPLTNWQPLKLYSGQNIIDFIRKNGGVAQLYFDDLELYDNW